MRPGNHAGEVILLSPLFAMAPTPGQSPLAGLIPVALMVAIFYFLLIAPVRKRQRLHDEMIKNLKTGDHVVTTGGIFGTVVGIQEDRLKLKVSDQVRIDVTKAAIASLAENKD